MHKDKVDLQQSVLSVTLALGFNGLITDILKLIVGTLYYQNIWEREKESWLKIYIK